MLDGLDLVDWDSAPQPRWNRPGEVPAALRALATASGDDDSWNAYHRVLYATGNNHAGTYYPVVLNVVPFLGEILRHGQVCSRLRALDILVDYLASFCPEPGYESVPAVAGPPRPLGRALHEAVARVWAVVGPEVESKEIDGRVAALAARLTDLLAEAARAG
jgi:hypothetical protein